MRGVGKGQTVTLLLIPEVAKLIDQTEKAVGHQIGGGGGGDRGGSEDKEVEVMLKRVVGWLTVNSVQV